MDPQTLVYLLGALVPIPVALVTKRYARPRVKVATNVVASALVASMAHLATADGHYDLAGFGGAFVAALVASVLSYKAVWQYTLVEAIERSTGRWGLGEVALAPVAVGALAVVGGGAVVARDVPAPPRG